MVAEDNDIVAQTCGRREGSGLLANFSMDEVETNQWIILTVFCVTSGKCL